MYTLWYQRPGDCKWIPFNTGWDIWQASDGRSLMDAFRTAQEAENVIAEWFSNGHNHWPVGVWDNNKNKWVVFYQMDAWPVINPQYGVIVVSEKTLMGCTHAQGLNEMVVVV